MAMARTLIPVVGFVAASGSGKTTLVKKLVPVLRERGLRIGYLKHAHHTFDLDRPGKDSHGVREAGASQTLLASRHRWALQVENPSEAAEPSLPDLMTHFDMTALDLILVEGFKHETIAKIEVYRHARGGALLYPEDPDIVAVATDGSLPAGHPPRLDLNDPAAVADFIELRLSEWGSEIGKVG
ncbi:molybdopterin-guanine dinucleotide biosynthesis protein MobB [Thioflavicoccus mobilis 8321]|uniref:Molybdopterin-guanine dinucleotide biosynthesis protein MobB n=1 Tax=Thioflavicoccus mobilis 8321 TaxID=765912 RepID=L0GYD4_9GAMM|nr:molybdopterin-guanine dinucleotide biosynthesis protein MobB [Thioflavicoccus mobilis 8321]